MLTHSQTPASLTAITPETVRAFFQNTPSYLLRHGTESSIFLYDNQHVIKLFTADEDGSPRKKCLAVEVENLQSLASVSIAPYALPQLIASGSFPRDSLLFLDSHGPRYSDFLMMSRVLGRAYAPDTSNRQAQREAERFNLTLGQALKSFHTQVLWAHEAPQTAFAPDAGPSAWSFQALAKHEPNVNRDTRAYCAAIRETAQTLCAGPPLRPVVLHGDLHIGNVLVHENGAVSGFVDVEKMCWGRPEQDLIFMGGLPHHFPAILQHYQTASPQVPFDENITFALAAAHFLAVGLEIQSQRILSENAIRESKKCLRTAVHLTRQLAERSGRFRSLSCAARACCF